MSLLDDPALRHALAIARPRPPGWMARFRSTSEIARVFGILAGTIGQIREPGWVDEDGRRRIVVWFESGGYCSGVPLDEVEAI